jgi:hypothetical protein
LDNGIIFRKFLLLAVGISDEYLPKKHLTWDQILENQSFLATCFDIDFLEELFGLGKSLVNESGFGFLEVEIIGKCGTVLAVGFGVVDDSYYLIVVMTE